MKPSEYLKHIVKLVKEIPAYMVEQINGMADSIERNRQDRERQAMKDLHDRQRALFHQQIGRGLRKPPPIVIRETTINLKGSSGFEDLFVNHTELKLSFEDHFSAQVRGVERAILNWKLLEMKHNLPYKLDREVHYR